jgi:hypothetical protein
LDDNLKRKSIQYAKDEEVRIEGNLRIMAYEIDAPSTLALIIGPGRIEKVCSVFIVIMKLTRPM